MVGFPCLELADEGLGFVREEGGTEGGKAGFPLC